MSFEIIPRAVAGIGLALALSAPAEQANAATLRWKFKEGEALHYQMEQKVSTQADVNGREIKATSSQTIDMTWKVGAVTPDGTAEITQTVERLRSKVESPVGSFEFDSKSDKEPEGPQAAAVVPALKAIAGATFQYKMSARGELSDVKIPEGLIKTLKESSPAAGAVGMFSEEGLKNMILESTLALPKEDLTKGKSWSKTTKLPSSPIGTMSLDKTYTYEGPGEGGETIALKIKVGLEPPSGGNLEIKLGKDEGKGTFLFDNAAGRVARSNVTQAIELTVSVMNQQITKSTTETTAIMTLIKDGSDASK